MATLYEINAEIEKLSEQMIDPETGEINEDIMEQLDALEVDRTEKVENIGCLIKSKEAFIGSLKNEKKALSGRIEREEKEVERLKKWLSEILEYKETFSTARLEIKWRASKRTEILDEDLIPDEYKEFKTTAKPSLSAIGKAIDAGNDIPGAIRVERKNIQIG